MSAIQALDAEGGIDLNVPVRVFNRSDVEVIWQYDRKKYVLPPGHVDNTFPPTYVPYMAMVLYQGDPRAVNIPGGKLHEQHRRQALEHLRVFHGVYDQEDRWAEIPLVECYPIDSDVRFETVLHDPDGTHLSDTTEGMTQLQVMQDAMERQAQQLRIMEARFAQMSQEAQAIEQSGIDPADLDRQETTARTIAPEGQSMVGPAPQRKVAAKGPVTRADSEPVTRDGEQ